MHIGVLGIYDGLAVRTALSVGLWKSIGKNCKLLISHSKQGIGLMEKYLCSNFKTDRYANARYSDMGMDSLERLAKTSQIYSCNIDDYTLPIVRDRADFLIGSMKDRDRCIDSEVRNIIYLKAKEHYDYHVTQIDWNAPSSEIQDILNHVDKVIICINQDKFSLEEYFESPLIIPYLNKKETVIAIMNYDSKSKYSVKNLKRMYNIKSRLHPVPYNTEFNDSLCDQRVREYFIRNINLKKSDYNYDFFSAIKEITHSVMP